jgi:hypothetical protein
MKKVLTKLLALSGIGLTMLAGCKKSDPMVVNSGAKSSSLTASATQLVLDKTKINDTSAAIMFTFTAPSYNYKAVVKNSLQIDAAGDNWKNPTSAQLGTSGSSQGYSTAAFNSLLLKLNLPAGAASTVNVRVVNALSTDVATYSNVVTLTVTPFNLTSWVYVPGAYEGWSFPGKNADSLISPTDNGVYSGIINFTAGNNQFLIVPAQSWSNKWATTSAAVNPTTPSVTYPVTYNGPNNFYAPTTPGYYLVTLNTNTNQVSIVPADYYSITGSAVQGWGVDTPMKYINDGNGNWVATAVPMTAAEYKFRQDDAWTNSWGPGATASTAVSSGATGDGNFQVAAAGNYNFTFNAPATTFGAPILTTTTYTVTKQ